MTRAAGLVGAIALLGLTVCPWLASAIEPDPLPPSLAHVKRIYMEPLTGGATSDQMRDMIISALQNSKLFIVTDNQVRADATLRGSSDDKIFTEEHSTSESIGLHANAGGGGASNNSMGGGSSSHQTSGAGISDSESSHIQERRHEATASIRLVNEEGDIIWSTTQESSGGKYRGAMADVADKIVRQLMEDTRKARGGH
jgi:predicted Zn-dependent protease